MANNIDKKEPVAICDQSKIDVTKCDNHELAGKCWYEKYGAVVAHISNDMIQYYLPKPVTGDTMPLAEEHMGYCDDTIFQGENLTSLAAELKKSTVWCFWWN